MRALLAALVLLSLAWGAFGGWVASEHSSAASALVTVDEPLSADARQLYESVADADVTISRSGSAWYAANAGVYRLGVAADYAGERKMVIGSSAAGYATLEGDISGAIADDQAVLRSAATAGSGVLDPLEPIVIVASLLMALGCSWGLGRRLAEYR